MKVLVACEESQAVCEEFRERGHEAYSCDIEPWSKKTCLWLKGLEPLKPTNIVTDYKPYCTSGSYSGTHDPKYKGASRKGGSAKIRSRTFPGIAKAMAEQWG